MPEHILPNPDARIAAARARVLTPEERQLLKETLGRDFEVLDDKPQLLYCVGSKAPYRHFFNKAPGLATFNQMLQTDKAVVFINRGNWEYQHHGAEQDFPTMNAAIDMGLSRRSRVSELLKKYGDFKTDRSIMDVPLEEVPKDKQNLVISIGHNNGLGNFGNSEVGQVLMPPKSMEAWDFRLELEITSSVWLEPHGRSGHRYYDQSLNLDPNNPRTLLEDQEALQRALEFESKNSIGVPWLRRVVDQYFQGDVAAFQKRWKEFYENWWPREFQAMQDCWDKCKEWLEKQKD